MFAISSPVLSRGIGQLGQNARENGAFFPAVSGVAEIEILKENNCNVIIVDINWGI